MNTAQRLDCSAEVLAALGPAVVARAREIAGEFNCAHCGRPGDARTAPTNLAAQRDRRGIVVMHLVHPQCGPSALTDVDTIALNDSADAGSDVSSHAVLFPTGTPGEEIACLIIDTTHSLTLALPSGDIDDFLTGALLARGWELVGSTAMALPVLDDVVVDLTAPAGRVLLLDGAAEPEILLDELPDDLPRWRVVAAATGAMMILAGRAGGAPMNGPKLQAAVRSGALVGCFARVAAHDGS